MKVVTKSLTGRPHTRLGGRDERREVYARFQAATAEVISFADFLKSERELGSWRMGQRRIRELSLLIHERKAELLTAYLELRLVANPEPLTRGDDVMSAAGDLMGAGRTGDEAWAAVQVVAMEAQRAFTDACREDLWYLPQWWQLHRRARLWWRGRRLRRTGAE